MAAASRPGRRTGAPRVEDLGIVDSLVQLSFLIQRVLSEVGARHELSVIQARLLGVLRDREPLMAELARYLNLDKSSVTGLVDRAERRGLVRRGAAAGDGRAVRVVLTAQGRQLAEAAGEEVRRQVTAMAASLAEADRRRLSALASQVVLAGAATYGVGSPARAPARARLG